MELGVRVKLETLLQGVEVVLVEVMDLLLLITKMVVAIWHHFNIGLLAVVFMVVAVLVVPMVPEQLHHLKVALML